MLIIELGFQLELDQRMPDGFSEEKPLPWRFWLGEHLRHRDRGLLQALLQATVVALQKEIPGLGETVAFAVKHIYAWVKENNPRVYVTDRYDKTQLLAGDPDGKLGGKRRSHQDTAETPGQPQEPSTPDNAPTSTAPQRPKQVNQPRKEGNTGIPLGLGLRRRRCD